jgi:transcriptional regulator with XRE-family HTH domain
MATANYGMVGDATAPIVPPTQADESEGRLHRIRSVRLRQGVSLRSAARNMGSDVRSLRMQEQESTDLRLSDLRRWQKALDVPLQELVEDGDGPLSRPVMERARLVRLMKTAMAIREHSDSDGIQRMAENLVNQLVEIMPELKDVSAWHTYGQRRSLDEYGRIMERRYSDDSIREIVDDD